MEQLISEIVEDWFLTEPLFFAAWCTHALRENTRICVPTRCGGMVVEYNPDLMKDWDRTRVEARLRLEVIRILLGHPYQRQPYKAKRAALGLASDMTISTLYEICGTMTFPSDLRFPRGLCFEEYYPMALDYLDKDLTSPPSEIEGMVDDGGGALSREEEESAGLWEEDDLAREQVKGVIERAQKTNQWGSLGGQLKETIEASLIVKIDYRMVLSSFRASVLSSRRLLTRMKPSRRYGFQNMGSKRDFSTRLLVAIDVSGSVSDRQISQALSITGRFFKYGVERIDVIQFDCGIKGEPVALKKAPKRFGITGRGGTDFQAPLNYCRDSGCYDGLLMITDGYAPEPRLPENFKAKVLWMIYSDSWYTGGNLDAVCNWIERFPRSRFLVLPPIK